MQQQSVSSLARWAQHVYVALAGLILLGIFTQGFLIGTMLFGGSASGRQAHGLLGMILVVFVLLQAISGLLTRFPSLIKWGSWLLFALVVIQILLPSLGAVAGSLHPANATLLFGVDVFLLSRSCLFTPPRGGVSDQEIRMEPVIFHVQAYYIRR